MTGVSIIDIHPTRMDGGNILLQCRENITMTDTFTSLTDRLTKLGSSMMVHVLNDLNQLRDQAYIQPAQSFDPSFSDSLRAPKLTANDAKLDFNCSAIVIYNKWRALNGFLNTYTTFRGQRMIILGMVPTKTEIINTTDSKVVKIGEMRWDETMQLLRIRCGDGNDVLVSHLQLEGKNPSDALDFANGYFRKRKPTNRPPRVHPNATLRKDTHQLPIKDKPVESDVFISDS